MDALFTFPSWLDALLIAPYRWPGNAHVGLWLGTALLNVYCIILGEITGGALFLLHHRYLNGMHKDMLRYHNISVDALHAGDKNAYLAANKMAHEGFGKSFFAQASIGMATLWPLPFALGWMAERFASVGGIYRIPGLEIRLGYVFVGLSLYILLRILFSGIKKQLPFFRHIEHIRQRARQERGTAKSFFTASGPDSV